MSNRSERWWRWILSGAIFLGLCAAATAEPNPGGVFTIDDATVIPAVMDKDPAKRKPARYAVLGTVADPATKISVRLASEGRAEAAVAATVSQEKRPDGGHAWSATVPGLKRGDNAVEVRLTPKAGTPTTVKKTVTLNPIVAEPPEGTAVGDGIVGVKGIAMVKYFVLDPRDVLTLGIAIDGKQVADTNMYLWETMKTPNGKHELKYTAKYPEGEYVRTVAVEVRN